MIISQDKVTPSVIPNINTDFTVGVDVKLSVKDKFNGTKHKYRCSCCGRGFTTQNSHFHKTTSPLYQKNDEYVDWCIDCADRYVQSLTKLYNGDEKRAVEHYCIQID